MSGQHQVDNEDPLSNESELDDGEASVLPASRSSQAAPTVTTGGVVETLLQHISIFGITRRNSYALLLIHCITNGSKYWITQSQITVILSDYKWINDLLLWAIRFRFVKVLRACFNY
jgi:hypothetical protein